MKRQNDYDRVAQYITASDLPRKKQKLDGLRLAAHKRIPMTLVREPYAGVMIVVDGIAIDPSELENGHWL